MVRRTSGTFPRGDVIIYVGAHMVAASAAVLVEELTGLLGQATAHFSAPHLMAILMAFLLGMAEASCFLRGETIDSVLEGAGHVCGERGPFFRSTFGASDAGLKPLDYREGDVADATPSEPADLLGHFFVFLFHFLISFRPVRWG